MSTTSWPLTTTRAGPRKLNSRPGVHLPPVLPDPLQHVGQPPVPPGQNGFQIAGLRARNIGLSLPSLRADTFSMSLMERLQRVRRGGLTFAPEAGTQRLRDAIASCR